MDNKKLSDFWAGFLLAIAVISGFLFLSRIDNKNQYQKIKKRMDVAAENPHPAFMDAFCAAADPDINAMVLFKKPRKNIGRKICLSGNVVLAMGKNYDDEFAYYHMKSDAVTVVLTLKQPDELEKLFESEDKLSCGGFETVADKNDYFDYYPHVRCKFAYLDEIKDVELAPKLKDVLIGKEWRKSILTKYSSKLIEIWQSEKDDKAIAISASPDGNIESIVLSLEPEMETEPDGRRDDSVDQRERIDQAEIFGKIIFETFLDSGSAPAASEWLRSKILMIGADSDSEKENSLQIGNATISFDYDYGSPKVSIEF